MGAAVRSEAGLGSWELFARRPHPLLRRHVLGGYTGYREDMLAATRRVEVPHPGIVVIVSLGPAIAVKGRAQTSFVAGLHEVPVTTEHTGRQLGIQVNFTPLGARMLLGLPMRELTGHGRRPRRAVGARGRGAGRAAGGAARLAGALRRARRVPARAAVARRPPAPGRRLRVVAAAAADGAVPIGALCDELGCSRRHLAARFGEEVGLAPKAMARVLRFNRAVERVRAGDDLAAVAAACGYYDQSHLTREFGALAGLPPAAYAAAQAPVDAASPRSRTRGHPVKFAGAVRAHTTSRRVTVTGRLPEPSW